MFRWIMPGLCGLVIIFTGQLAHARADHMEAPALSVRPATVDQIDWGGVVSRGRMRTTGLPAIQGAREAARLKSRKGARSAPGERLSRPEFGASRDKASGLATGKRRHKPITIRKRVDGASPMLRRAHRTGRVLPRVVIKARNTRGGKRVPYLLWELKQVRITSYSVSGSGQAAQETVRFTYDSVGNLTTR